MMGFINVAMAILFGFTGTKGPVYDTLLKTSVYEIRSYRQFLTAEVADRDNDAFMKLAKYIGVFGKALNEESKSMAMTHPVLKESIKSENKVEAKSSDTMKFVLPEDFVDISQAPKPLDSQIHLRTNPPQYVAVYGYSGWYSPEGALKNLGHLSQSLYRDEFISTTDYNNLDWSVAQYHPPFTLPFLRLNEIWIKLNPEQSIALRKLLREKEVK